MVVLLGWRCFVCDILLYTTHKKLRLRKLKKNQHSNWSCSNILEFYQLTVKCEKNFVRNIIPFQDMDSQITVPQIKKSATGTVIDL